MLATAALALLCAVSTAPAATQRDVQDAVARHLGIYLTRDDRREEHERVVLKGTSVEIWFLRALPSGARAQAVCDGVRWLLLGRLAGTSGVQGFFGALEGVEEVSLIFYELETRLELDARGRYTQERNAAPRARFTISRQRASTLDRAGLAATLRGDACSTSGGELLDALWLP